MKILMVSSEAVPYSKSGGLADVTSSLSKALANLNNDVRLVLPNYLDTDDSFFTKLDFTLEIKIANKDEIVKIKEFKDGPLIVYLVDHPSFSERKGLYGESSYTPYADNLIRYTLVSKASLELCKKLNWKPNVIHAHDWTTGFLPSLIKADNSKFFKDTKSVFTIHNLAYQGEFSRLDALAANLPVEETIFSGSGIDKKVNMMANAIKKADMITTVSPTYAKEIQEAEYGNNLENILTQRKNDLVGILNGIDTDEWNPETDQYLDIHFSKENLSNKQLLKKAVQQQFNLKVDSSVAVIGMISRIAEQKGFVELTEGSPSPLEQILHDFNVQIVIIGTGDKHLEEKIASLAQLNNNLSANFIFDNKAAHLVEAGSDFFLMPSRYEPCGLNQMYSLRYGTIPIARRTGGLADSIIDVSEPGGTGFLFDKLSGAEIYATIRRALNMYEKEADKLLAVRQRGMAFDFSWTNSAREYLEAYK